MRRMIVLVLLTVLWAWGASSALAKKPLAKDPLPFPTDGQAWAALDTEQVMYFLQQTGGIQDFTDKVVPQAWANLQSEFGPRFDAFGDQVGIAWDSTLTRVVTVLLGGLLLWLPHRLHVVGWLFLGIVAGVVLVQTDVATALMTEIFPNESALQTGLPMVAITILLVALMGGISSGLLFLALMSASAWLAGGLLGAELFNSGVFDLTSPAVFVPAIAFSIMMSIAVARGSKLVAALIGAALVVAALHLSASLIPLIGIVAIVISLIRTRYAKAFKRETLPSLSLEEGKVLLTNPARKHLHGTSPEMNDDSDNSPFKAL